MKLRCQKTRLRGLSRASTGASAVAYVWIVPPRAIGKLTVLLPETQHSPAWDDDRAVGFPGVDGLCSWAGKEEFHHTGRIIALDLNEHERQRMLA